MVLLAALVSGAIDVVPAGAGPERLTHVRVSELTRPPPGWIEFCERQPGDCVGATTTPRDFALTLKNWKDLVRVNKRVNETIKPLSDLEHWGVVERWSYPADGYGDCEDYVLLKRRILIQSGWPRETLLVTVVRDKKGKGHAVLTVTTDKGDHILDNETEDIRLWWKTVSSNANRGTTPMCGSRWAIHGRQSPQRPHSNTFAPSRSSDAAILLRSRRCSCRCSNCASGPD